MNLDLARNVLDVLGVSVSRPMSDSNRRPRAAIDDPDAPLSLISRKSL